MRAFKPLLSVLLCLVLFAGCGGKSGSAEQLARNLGDRGVTDWHEYAATAQFAEDGVPHLFALNACLLIYCGIDEDLLTALSELWQLV